MENKIMKNLVTIIVLVFLAVMLKAANNESLSYVTANGKTYFCHNIKFGIFKTKITTNDGKKIAIPNSSVKAYMHNGRLFEKLPVICNNNDTVCKVLMEYITSREGLKLYRYSRYSEHCDYIKGNYKSAHPDYCYFVFRDNKFYLHVDEKNYSNVFDFFGVNNNNNGIAKN